MVARTSLSTRIAVGVLVGLAVLTASVTTYLVARPVGASHIAAPVDTPSPTAKSLSTPPPKTPELVAFEQGILTSAANGAYPEKHISDLLANHLYVTNGRGVAAPLSKAIVVATFVSIRPAAGHRWLVELDVSEVISGDWHVGATAVVTPLAQRAAKAIRDLTPSDQLLLVLDNPLNESEPPRLRQDGDLWIDARGGCLSVLGLTESDSRAFLSGLTTLDALRHAAALPSTVRELVNGTIVP